MSSSNNDNNNNDDDEFDDLFSFSVAEHSPTTTTTKSMTKGTIISSTDNDLVNTAMTQNTSIVGGGDVKDGGRRASSSISDSYVMDGGDDDDDDDIFGEFNLASMSSTANVLHHQDDFNNGMDEGTREFLYFLENDSKVITDSIIGNGNSQSISDNVSGTIVDSDDVMKDIFGDNDNSNGKTNTATGAVDILAGLDDSDSSEDEIGDDDDDDGNETREHNSRDMIESNQDPINFVSDITSEDANDHTNVEENDEEVVAGFVTINSTDTKDSSGSVRSVDIDSSPTKSMPTNLTMIENTSTNVSNAYNSTSNSTEKLIDVRIFNANEAQGGEQRLIENPKLVETTIPATSSVAATLAGTPGSPKIPTLPSSPSVPIPKLTRDKSILTSADSDEEIATTEVQELKLDNIKTISNKNESKNATHDNSQQVETAKVDEEKQILEEVTFDSLRDALQSSQSKMDHIRSFMYYNKRHNHHPQQHLQSKSTSMMISSITEKDRPFLWSKVICGKVLTDVQSSSLADSFIRWNSKDFDYEKFLSREETHGLDGDSDVNDEAKLTGKDDDDIKRQSFVAKILNEVDTLARRLYTRGKRPLKSQFQLDDDDDVEDNELVNAKRELCSLLVFYYMSVDKADRDKHTIEWKSLLGPIAVTLLSAQIPIEVASVMLSTMISTLPLVSLAKFEQFTAVKSLHQQLYFLVCYHLPLLVLHLDRYAPGWHWPKVYATKERKDENNPTMKGRNLEANGTIPITWFASLLAGEGSYVRLDNTKLLPLWDLLLTCDDRSLIFFLALAVLEKHSDSLMMLRGEELVTELSAVMSMKPTPNNYEESFQGHQSVDEPMVDDAVYVLQWYHDARILQASTPTSILIHLQKAEDTAVNHILAMRSKIALEKMTARLEAEAEAHRKAVEEENARKEEERIYQYYKKHLLNFYEKHCPEKKASVDKILEAYKDKYLILDQQLQQKYGHGYLPILSLVNPKLTNKTSKFISSVGQGIETRKKNLVVSRAKERAEKLDEDIMGPGTHQVAMKVSASEVLPFICDPKMKGSSGREPLKYYLVDSRPSETIKLQGAFPTSAHLSPEDLMDPDCILEKVDIFESLRGAVHICIMGEGFSAFPTLYDHPLDEMEEKLLQNDESRTNMCALFFIKKGFPFISVLDGGFAAAHAWLARDYQHVSIGKVLIDYDDQTSLFADLERAFQEQKEYSNASNRRKTTLALQKLIDNSMTRITRIENRIEEFAERPRGNNNKSENEGENHIVQSENDKESTVNTKSPIKLPPMKLFKKRNEDALKESQSLPGDDVAETTIETASNENASVEQKTNNSPIKKGLDFNKAFNGIRNIRGTQRSIRGQTAQGIMKEKETDKREQQMNAFNFSNISFTKNSNMFGMKGKKTNKYDDLEKEIEASLMKPVEANDEKVTKDRPATETKRVVMNNPFKSNPLKKINLNKLSGVASSSRTMNNASAPIMREEESLFFDEETVDSTEDTASSKLNEDTETTFV